MVRASFVRVKLITDVTQHRLRAVAGRPSGCRLRLGPSRKPKRPEGRPTNNRCVTSVIKPRSRLGGRQFSFLCCFEYERYSTCGGIRRCTACSALRLHRCWPTGMRLQNAASCPCPRVPPNDNGRDICHGSLSGNRGSIPRFHWDGRGLCHALHSHPKGRVTA